MFAGRSRKRGNESAATIYVQGMVYLPDGWLRLRWRIDRQREEGSWIGTNASSKASILLARMGAFQNLDIADEVDGCLAALSGRKRAAIRG